MNELTNQDNERAVSFLVRDAERQKRIENFARNPAARRTQILGGIDTAIEQALCKDEINPFVLSNLSSVRASIERHNAAMEEKEQRHITREQWAQAIAVLFTDVLPRALREYQRLALSDDVREFEDVVDAIMGTYFAELQVMQRAWKDKRTYAVRKCNLPSLTDKASKPFVFDGEDAGEDEGEPCLT